MCKAVFCYCKNTYSIECKDRSETNECTAPKYWQQGIGKIQKES